MVPINVDLGGMDVDEIGNQTDLATQATETAKGFHRDNGKKNAFVDKTTKKQEKITEQTLTESKVKLFLLHYFKQSIYVWVILSEVECHQQAQIVCGARTSERFNCLPLWV